MQFGLLEGKSAFSVVRADENSTRGWRSQYYGEKEPAISAMLETDQVHALFWTFFGFDSDMVKLVGNTLQVSSTDWKTSIDLGPLNK